MRRPLVILLLLVVAWTGAAPAQQSARSSHTRRWIGTLVGMAIAGGASLIYSSEQRPEAGRCTTAKCVTTVSVITGGVLGFLIGRELDQQHQRLYRYGPPLTLRGQHAVLTLPPRDVAARGGTASVAGDGGVELFDSRAALVPTGVRARGVRGVIGSVPLPEQGRLLVATSTGLYGFPLTGERVAGDLLAPGEVTAVAARGDRVLVAAGTTVRAGRLSGDSLIAAGPPRSLAAATVDVAWQEDGARAWVLTEEGLVAFTVGDSGLADSLGAYPLVGSGRRLSLLGDTLLAVAAGRDGALLLSVRDPAAPHLVSQWANARFAYDVALATDALYLAAGPEGLYVLAPGQSGTTIPVGLARNLGFVAALALDGADLFVVDRAGGKLYRVPIRN